MKQRAVEKGAVLTPVMVDRSPAARRKSGTATVIAATCSRLSQTGEKQQVKTVTSKMWFRHYYVAYAFVYCMCVRVCVRACVLACVRVCVKVNNEDFFFNAIPFGNSYYFIS